MALTAEGLEIRRFPEVLEDIVTDEQSNIDPDINTDDDELLGQLNQIIAQAIADQEALAEAVNDNFNPLKAEGLNLDDLANIIGISRIAATESSTTTQTFTGDDGTVVPLGSILQNPNTSDRFLTSASVTLSISDCISCSLSVQNVLNNTNYIVVVNSTPYDYLSDGDATEAEILSGLKALVDADGSATWTATVNGSLLELATSDSSNIAVSGLVQMLPGKATDSGSVKAEFTGELVVSPNTVTVIVTAVSGWDSTTNPDAYIKGRDQETDEELRVRFLQSQQIAGSATVPAIEDSVRNLSGVLSTSVFENRSFVVDGDGRPPKSFETIVEGGTDQEVAQQIYDSKPAGIETYGITVSLPVIDSLGNTAKDSDGSDVLINFTRPAAVNLAYRVTYSVYDEEVFPVGGEDGIKDAVVTYTESLGVDVDVIPSRAFGFIYALVSGIDSLVVEVQEIATSGDVPNPANWQTTRLPIDLREFAATTLIDIEVIEV